MSGGNVTIGQFNTTTTPPVAGDSFAAWQATASQTVQFYATQVAAYIVTTATTAGFGSMAFQNASGVAITGGAVTATGGTLTGYTAITTASLTATSANITGGTVTATGGTLTGYTAITTASLTATSANITGGTVTATGGTLTGYTAITTGALTATAANITGGTVTASSVTSTNVNITGGTVTATGGTLTGYTAITTASMTSTGGMTISGGGAAISGAVTASGTLTVTDDIIATDIVRINSSDTTERLNVGGAIRISGSAANFASGSAGGSLDYAGSMLRVHAVPGSGTQGGLGLGLNGTNWLTIATSGVVSVVGPDAASDVQLNATTGMWGGGRGFYVENGVLGAPASGWYIDFDGTNSRAAVTGTGVHRFYTANGASLALDIGFSASTSRVVGTWSTTSAGLAAGTIWNNGGVANIA